MTVHLAFGAGSYSGGPPWSMGAASAERRALMEQALSEPGSFGTACGMIRPNPSVTVDEERVTCGSCRRTTEFGDNHTQQVARERERARHRALAFAARNRALRALVDAHHDEFVDLFEAERTLLALAHGTTFPPDEALPAIPRRVASAE